MKIIALQGKPSCGKTTTLKALIKTIIENNIFDYVPIVSKEETLEKCQKEHCDLQCWFNYNGVKIGVTTRGDGAEVLNKDFYEREHNFADCDIVVCAIHSKGNTIKFVKDKGNNGLLIHTKWFVAGECCDDDIKTANSMQAEVIINDIKKFAESIGETK